MKKQFVTVLVVYLFAFLLALNGKAQDNAPLKLVQKIPMPGVQGRNPVPLGNRLEEAEGGRSVKGRTLLQALRPPLVNVLTSVVAADA